MTSNPDHQAPLVGRPPTLGERLARRLFHLWPFLSGCGTIASSRLSKVLVPPSASAVWGRVGGLPCLVPLDDLVGRAIFLVGDLDRKVTWVLARGIRSGDTVLDVGANLGLVTLFAARRAGPDGRVFSFEPSPRILPYLRATIEAASTSRNVPSIELMACALGREKATLKLTVPTGNAGKGSLVAEMTVGESFEVSVETLADVLAEQQIAQIDVMKVDVEGFETDVFQGLFASPTAPRPGVIVFEENAPSQSRSLGTLRAAGYRLFGIPARRWALHLSLIPEDSEDFLRCHDFVAVHADLDPGRSAALGVSAQ